MSEFRRTAVRSPLRIREGVLVLFVIAGFGRTGFGSPPIQPLPAPFYSFDLFSPQVSATGMFQAGDVLKVVHPPAPQPPRPEVVIPAELLRLDRQGDELDAASAPNLGVSETMTFALLISVDRATVGQAMPEPALALLDVPYNVRDQAARGHAAGDLFMTTRLFTLNGMVPGPARMLGGNTALLINNYDEGGTDFAAQPETSAQSSSNAAQDEVDATVYNIETNGVRGVPPVPILFYTAAKGSPSLLPPTQLPGNSGADIFRIVLKPGMTPSVFASATTLGLQPADDIDALLVFDDGDFTFDAGDLVLCSLTADSPSLQMLAAGPADILSVTRPTGGGPQIAFFARAADLGLMGANSPDNIDGLEFFFCTDATECARVHGIRRVGDINRDTKVDLFDAHFFWSCFSGPSTDPNFVPPTAACQGAFDTDEDTDVDGEDWQRFAHDMTGPL